MQGVTIAGALVATTADIQRVKREDDSEGQDRDHMPGWEFIRRLDPDGFHVLCTRPEGLPGSVELAEDHPAWSGQMTLGDHLHFEGLFKLAGRKEPTRQWITLTVAEAAALEPAPATAPALRITTIDGETQR